MTACLYILTIYECLSIHEYMSLHMSIYLFTCTMHVYYIYNYMYIYLASFSFMCIYIYVFFIFYMTWLYTHIILHKPGISCSKPVRKNRVASIRSSNHAAVRFIATKIRVESVGLLFNTCHSGHSAARQTFMVIEWMVVTSIWKHMETI